MLCYVTESVLLVKPGTAPAHFHSVKYLQVYVVLEVRLDGAVLLTNPVSNWFLDTICIKNVRINCLSILIKINGQYLYRSSAACKFVSNLLLVNTCAFVSCLLLVNICIKLDQISCLSILFKSVACQSLYQIPLLKIGILGLIVVLVNT